MIVAEGAIAKPDADRPQRADFLQPQGWVPRVRPEELEVLIRNLADGLRQLPVMEPELWRGEVIQRAVVRPAS